MSSFMSLNAVIASSSKRVTPVITNRIVIPTSTTNFVDIDSTDGMYDAATDAVAALRITNTNTFALYLFFLNAGDDPATRDQYSYDAVVPAGTTGETEFLGETCRIYIGFGGGSSTTQPIPVATMVNRYTAVV